MTSKLEEKSNTNHHHSKETIDSIDANKISGIIPIENMP